MDDTDEPQGGEPVEEPTAAPAAPDHAPPMRGAWLVVALAAVCLVCATVTLELMTRAETVRYLGREPASWSDPQLHEFLRVFWRSPRYRSGASDNEPPEDWRDLVKDYRAVAEMRPKGDVAAAAYLRIAALADEAKWCEGWEYYAYAAFEAVPDDHHLLYWYFQRAVLPPGWRLDPWRITQMGSSAFDRARTPEQKDLVATWFLDCLRAAGYPSWVPWVLCERGISRLPTVAGNPWMRWEVAGAYRQMGQWDRACVELTKLIPKAEPKLRERAQNRLAQLRRGLR